MLRQLAANEGKKCLWVRYEWRWGWNRSGRDAVVKMTDENSGVEKGRDEEGW